MQVLVTCVQVLQDVSLLKGVQQLQIDNEIFNRLLTALNEANEWGQAFLIDFLTNYQPTSSLQA